MSENWPRLQWVSKEQPKRGLTAPGNKNTGPAQKVLLGQAGVPGWTSGARVDAGVAVSKEDVARQPQSLTAGMWLEPLTLWWGKAQGFLGGESCCAHRVAAAQHCPHTPTLRGPSGMASWAPKTRTCLILCGSERVFSLELGACFLCASVGCFK